MKGFAVDLEFTPDNGIAAFYHSVQEAWEDSSVKEEDNAYKRRGNSENDRVYRNDKAEQEHRWVWANAEELTSKYALPSAFRYYVKFLP